MSDRPHEGLSDEELYHAYEAASDAVGGCVCGDLGNFSWDRPLNRWRCDACGEPQTDEQVRREAISVALYSEIGWRSVYMQLGDGSSWLAYQEAQQRIAKLESEIERLKAQEAEGGGEEQGDDGVR